MHTKTKILINCLIICMLLTGCGVDPKLTKFKQDIEDFCITISEIDTSINNVNAESEYATTELLGYLDELDMKFQVFAQLDFPEEFDYLEALADEASAYMTTAVESYHEAYKDNSYVEATAQYAQENYSRAYKRIQIIITFLHGDQLENGQLPSSEGN